MKIKTKKTIDNIEKVSTVSTLSKLAGIGGFGVALFGMYIHSSKLTSKATSFALGCFTAGEIIDMSELSMYRSIYPDLKREASIDL